MKSIKKIIKILFVLLIITATLSYIIQAVQAVINKQYLLRDIYENNIQTGIVENLFPYCKDIIAIILFLMLFIFFKKSRKTAGIFLAIILYGTLILLSHQNYEIGYIIAGIRMFLYFFVTIMYFQSIEENKNDFKIIFKTIVTLIVIEFCIIFIQVLYSGQIHNFGNGGYRFCGTFGNAIAMGNFTVAANLYILIYNYITKTKNKNLSYIYMIMILLLSIASGTRLTIFLNILIIYMYWCIFTLDKFKLSKKVKFICMFTTILIAAPIIYKFFINRIGRGEIMLSGGVRIDILKSFFDIQNMRDLVNLLIGQGIGFTTNAAYLLKLDSTFIVDGTYTTIIAQFGLIGLIIFAGLLLKLVQKIWRYSNKNINIMLAYFATIIFTMASGNIFEQIAMIILIVIEYFMLKNYSEETEKKKE